MPDRLYDILNLIDHPACVIDREGNIKHQNDEFNNSILIAVGENAPIHHNIFHMIDNQSQLRDILSKTLSISERIPFKIDSEVIPAKYLDSRISTIHRDNESKKSLILVEFIKTSFITRLRSENQHQEQLLQKQKQIKQLEYRTARFRELISVISKDQSIVFFDYNTLENRITDSVSGDEIILGYQKNEWQERDFLFNILQTQEAIEEIKQSISKAKTTQSSKSKVCPIRFKDSSLRHVIFILYKPREDGPFSESNTLSVVLIDVSENHRLEDERRELLIKDQRSLKYEGLIRVAGQFAHDFNNILSVLLCESELRLDDNDLSEDARESFTEIYHSSIRASEITNKMLLFSGRSVVKRSMVSISELIEKSIEKLPRSRSKKHICLDQSLEPTVTLYVSRDIMIIAILALLENAFDFRRNQDCVITISKKEFEYIGPDARVISPIELEPQKYLELEIMNESSNDISEIQDQIFDPFFSTKPESTIKGKGTGLSLASGIMSAHDGAVSIYQGSDQNVRASLLLPFHCVKESIGHP